MKELKKCLICRSLSYNKFCSNSCRCKDYYRKHREKELERGIKRYLLEKENNYEKLREINKKDSRKYKSKNKDLTKEKNKEYQVKTQQSKKYYEKKYFNDNRHKVLERDNYKCQNCGEQKIKTLVVHHKDRSGRTTKINNSLENLITLCRKCHINEHREDLKQSKI